MFQQDWAARWAVYSPEKIAFKEFETGRTLTFRELNNIGNALAYHLRNTYKITKGDRIAFLAENCLEVLLFLVAAQKSGAILVPLNYRLASAELDYLLETASPRLIVWEEQFRIKFEQTSQHAIIPHSWSLQDMNSWIDDLDTTLIPPPFPLAQVKEDDPIFILFTSGTTGFPKGALYTHKMLFWNSVNTALSLVINTASRTINCMPFFHTGGLNVLTSPFLHRGGYTCIMKKFEAETVLNLIEQERATLFMGVPTMLKMMADMPAFDDASFNSLHYIIVGGEPMPIPLIERWHKKGVPIRQGYGMTEVGPNLTSLHQDDAIRKKGSIGRPNFYVQTQIIKQNGQEAGPNQTGELLLKGPMVTPGYWKDEAATSNSIKNGWFHTGDLVREDEEGYLYVVDRIKNMFISGGENIYPAEVERVLLTHPGVSEAAVIGVADARWGEVGKAFVVLKPGESLSKEALQQFCQSKLAKFKIPKSFTFISFLPKTDTGKIDRKQLAH